MALFSVLPALGFFCPYRITCRALRRLWLEDLVEKLSKPSSKQVKAVCRCAKSHLNKCCRTRALEGRLVNFAKQIAGYDEAGEYWAARERQWNSENVGVSLAVGSQVSAQALQFWLGVIGCRFAHDFRFSLCYALRWRGWCWAPHVLCALSSESNSPWTVLQQSEQLQEKRVENYSDVPVSSPCTHMSPKWG